MIFRRKQPQQAVSSDPAVELPDDILAIIDKLRPYTMTSAERIAALVDAMRYLLDRNIDGALVECGVWRGGSILAMIHCLQEQDAKPRDIYLYDTFEGMTEPTEHDVAHTGETASEEWKQSHQQGKRAWDNFFSAEAFDFDSVRETLLATGYPEKHLHFVKGPVEETLPTTLPERIALLRLDTDWYESTLHELNHLYPLLCQSGVLIIDDYGHWQGCRRAVDEYFASPQVASILLNRIDYTGRIAIKG